jgi:CHAT domain-containing protein
MQKGSHLFYIDNNKEALLSGSPQADSATTQVTRESSNIAFGHTNASHDGRYSPKMEDKRQRPHTFFTALLITLVQIAGTTVSAAPQADSDFLQQAESAYRSGNLETAARIWSDVAAQARVQQDIAGEIHALARAAGARQGQGQNQAAVDQLKQALQLAENINDKTYLADISHRLGAAYLLLYDTASARPLLNEARQIAHEQKNGRLEAAVALSSGNLEQLTGNSTAATGHYIHGMALADRLSDASLQSRIAASAGQLSLQAGDYSSADSWLARAGVATGKLPASRDKAYLLIRVARLQLQLAEFLPESAVPLTRAAYAGLQAAEQVADQLGDPRARSWALGYLGELYESQGRFDEAIDLTRRAIYAIQGLHAPEVLFRWEWQQGRLLNAKADRENAIRAYGNAIHTLHSVRTELAASLEQSRKSYHRLVGPLYLEYADLLLQEGEAATDPAESQLKLVEARDAVELMKTVELQDYFQDDCVSLARSRVKGLEETLSANTAVVYPILFPDRTDLLVSTSDGLLRHTVPVTAGDMTSEVNDFRRKLEKRTTRQYMRPARRLYDWLIRPLEQELVRRGIDTLVIVPDAALRTIPMAALHDGERFLVHKYALASTPSLELTDPRPIRAQNIDMLLNGLTDPVQGFPGLPNVAAELATLQSMYGGRLLENADFSSDTFQGALAEHPYSVVHIASHGKFEGKVSDSFILTYNDRLTMDDLEHYIGLSQVRVDQPVELLTLSACQTAAGDDWAGLGLASIAIKAGARSALATLWHVNDKVTSELIAGFYRNLGKPDTTKAEALQQAQLKILTDMRYRHPAYWAPYLLIGNWL